MDGFDSTGFRLLSAWIEERVTTETNHLIETVSLDLYPGRVATIRAYKSVQDAMQDIAKQINSGEAG